MSDFLISPNYRYRDWQKLTFSSEGEWKIGIDIVEDRIKGRFSKWIDQIEPHRFSGFAVVALDCLLLETIHGFQQGTSTKDTKAAYRSLLPSIDPGFDNSTVESFIKNVRNGIVHDSETRGKWLIERDRPSAGTVEKDSSGNFVLNRVQFHSELKRVPDHWLEQLRSGDVDATSYFKTSLWPV